MSRPVKILHLEDIRSDADLIKREMTKSNLTFEWLWVSSENDFLKALREFAPDIILSDHSLPGFSSIDALQAVKNAGLNIPFILISATVSEEFAAITMQQGVTHYLLKDNIRLLPVTVMNVLENHRTEMEKKLRGEK
jgi:DNA-binding NtrC family response regulator